MNNYEKLIVKQENLSQFFNFNSNRDKMHDYLIDNLLKTTIDELFDFLPEYGYRVEPYGIKEFLPKIKNLDIQYNVQQLAESLFSLVYLNKSLWLLTDSHFNCSNLSKALIKENNEILSNLETSRPYETDLRDVLDKVNSSYIIGANWYNYTIEEMENCISEFANNKGILITRLGKYSLDSIKEYYSSNNPIIIRLSGNLYYNATSDKWLIVNKINFNKGWRNDDELFTKASARWFISNFRQLFKDLFIEKPDEVYQYAEEKFP